VIVALLTRWAVNLLALWVAAELLDDVSYDEFSTLVVAALVFGLVNFAIRPIVTILTLPLIIITLGIAYFFVNLLMLLLTAALVDGFRVDGFWTAVGATIVIWLVNSLVGALARDVESRPARGRGS
jgi:putative membrane protein